MLCNRLDFRITKKCVCMCTYVRVCVCVCVCVYVGTVPSTRGEFSGVQGKSVDFLVFSIH